MIVNAKIELYESPDRYSWFGDYRRKSYNVRVKPKLFLLLTSTLIALMFMEFVARKLGYGRYFLLNDVVFEADRGYIEGAIKFTASSFDWYIHFPDHLDDKESVNINGIVYPVKKNAGVSRFLFLGDSGTFGSGVKWRENFPSVIGQKLSSSPVEIINAGVPGMSTVDEWLLFQKMQSLHPDQVVLAVFMANDLNLNLTHTQSISFDSSHPYWVEFVNSSALFKLLYLRYFALKNSVSWVDVDGIPFFDHPLVDEHGLNLSQYVDGEISTYMKKESAVLTSAYGVFEGILRKFRRLAETRHFNFTVLLIPTNSSVTHQINIPYEIADENYLKSRGIRLSDLDFEKSDRRVLELCEKNGIHCISVLQDVKAGLGKRFFREGDDHPSAEGHRLLAEKLTSSINFTFKEPDHDRNREK